ncbi:MAG: MaoC family dehydratase [Bacteroidota bacterium]|nr:MaoC family dehydratase [Bacteroidota bacterium]
MVTNGKERFGRYLEEFHLGDIYKHWPGKTIMESDNNLFCLLTRNPHPVHSDVEYVKALPHGKILVVGTLVISLVVGMSVADTSGKAIANLEYEKVTHDAPVFIGDTIYAESEISDVRESTGKQDRGIVSITTRAYNQNGKQVLTMSRTFLVFKRGA